MTVPGPFPRNSRRPPTPESPMPILRATLVPAIVTLAFTTSIASAQASKAAAKPAVTLPALLATYLADSGVRTRGLSWGTGGDLGIKWSTTKPTKPQYTVGPGITLQHEGVIAVQAADTLSLDMNVIVFGNDAGIQRFIVSWDMEKLPGEKAEALLTDAGWKFQSLKCNRETEGYSYGNLLYAAKAPGKTASGLLEGWNCAHDGCTISMTIYYRKADVEQFDCAGA